MSIYSTVGLTRKEAIDKLMTKWKMPHQMTNEELETALFGLFGNEYLEDSELHNYQVSD